MPLDMPSKSLAVLLERNRAPLDAEDGVSSSASLAATALRTAWQLANSVSQLVTPDASWSNIWAWHTTANMASTTSIASRPLQKTRDEFAATAANPLIRDEGQMQCKPKGRARWRWPHELRTAQPATRGSYRKMLDASGDWPTRNAGVRNAGDHP